MVTCLAYTKTTKLQILFKQVCSSYRKHVARKDIHNTGWAAYTNHPIIVKIFSIKSRSILKTQLLE